MDTSAKDMPQGTRNPLPPPLDHDVINDLTAKLVRHMSKGSPTETPFLPVILLELASRKALCQNVQCTPGSIVGRDYRITVIPGFHDNNESNSHFHVVCFEKIADFSNFNIISRFRPHTRCNNNLYGLSDRRCVNGGAERLTMEWVRKIRNLYLPHDPSFLEHNLRADPAFKDMYFRAGSKEYVSSYMPRWLNHGEALLMRTHLRPIESDLPDEGEGSIVREVVTWGSKGKEAETYRKDDGIPDEWDLFRTYVSVHDGTETRTSLSRMIGAWKQDTSIVSADESELTEEEKARKKVLGGNGVRAVKRLSETFYRTT